MLNAGYTGNMPDLVDLGCSYLKMVGETHDKALFVGMVRVSRRLVVLQRLFLPIMRGLKGGPKGR